MIRLSDLTPYAKTSARFAEPPWPEDSERWRELDEKLPGDHLAREIRAAMTYLDLAPLYRTYRGLGKAPYRPDLMLAMVCFELRRGQTKPSRRLGIGCQVAYHLDGLLVGVTEWDGHLYSARKPQKSNRLGGHFATQLVISLGYR